MEMLTEHYKFWSHCSVNIVKNPQFISNCFGRKLCSEWTCRWKVYAELT